MVVQRPPVENRFLEQLPDMFAPVTRRERTYLARRKGVEDILDRDRRSYRLSVMCPLALKEHVGSWIELEVQPNLE